MRFVKDSQGKKLKLIRIKKEINDWIWKNCYNEKLKSLTQYPKTNYQDATNLLFVLLHFLDKNDPLTKEIIKNTCKELSYKDVFVYRYKRKDEFKGKEGAFILCSFWLISALAITGQVKEAERLFKKFEKLIGDNGLISEEISPENKEYLGNYPQAFSHMGYIMSAYYIDKYKKRKK